ncbi:hypothetical protein SeLEV6574_g05269 [Synchytrium endobioticum]|uniref:Uncharacterized protein n=1 Tax=Synchytrium endobioticum TaxID=286115 RepID=A0A507CV60_9FUNG|nr:hypothetical protein SeLEV6574_g05269 [Synchytrium endobioticum]
MKLIRAGSLVFSLIARILGAPPSAGLVPWRSETIPASIVGAPVGVQSSARSLHSAALLGSMGIRGVTQDSLLDPLSSGYDHTAIEPVDIFPTPSEECIHRGPRPNPGLSRFYKEAKEQCLESMGNSQVGRERLISSRMSDLQHAYNLMTDDSNPTTDRKSATTKAFESIAFFCCIRASNRDKKSD